MKVCKSNPMIDIVVDEPLLKVATDDVRPSEPVMLNRPRGPDRIISPGFLRILHKRTAVSRPSRRLWCARGEAIGNTVSPEEDKAQCYIIVGKIGKNDSLPRELLFWVKTPMDLPRQIASAEKQLRSPARRLLSLKRVGAFSLYQCHPGKSYHSAPEISNETKRYLAEMYRDYRTGLIGRNPRWLDWIHENFNNSSNNPTVGTYSLQLVLQWSPARLIIWSIVPIVLSLAVGLGYMLKTHPGEDYVAVVQTAWTIASYIVTTATRKSTKT